MAKEKVDYTTAVTPSDYKCQECGATGCKLWRDGGSFFSIELLCVDCAARDQKKDISSINEEGCRLIGQGMRGRTDQIGWYVPAVPQEERIGYWGYGSVPDAGVQWWKRLPLRQASAA